jgi:hypothetical protein
MGADRAGGYREYPGAPGAIKIAYWFLQEVEQCHYALLLPVNSVTRQSW